MVDGTTADGSGDAKDLTTPTPNASGNAPAASAPATALQPHATAEAPKGSRKDRKRQKRENRHQAAPVVTNAATVTTTAPEAPVDAAPDVIDDAPATAAAVDHAPEVIADAPAVAAVGETDVVDDSPAPAAVVDSEPEVIADVPAQAAGAVDDEPEVIGDGPAAPASGLVIDMTADDAGDDEEAPVAIAPELVALAERLRNGRAVLCAGARLGSGEIRTYRATVDKVLAALPEGDASEARRVLDRRPLAAAGFVRRRLGERFAGELQRASTPTAELSDAVRLLGELPFRAVVTTTWDDAFERAFTRDGQVPRIYTPHDHVALAADGKARFIFKALGDPARAETVVFSAEDVQAALADGGYRSVAHDLYRSRSFLFVGFEGQDPDLGILLERVLSGARAGDAEHYAVIPGLGAIEREELYAAYRIRVLEAEDVVALARALKATVGNGGPALPDDDDFEGWLLLLAEDPTRQDGIERLDQLTVKLRELADWERLVDLQLGRVGVEGEAARRAELLEDVGRIFEAGVGDLSRAFTARIAAYKEHPRASAWDDLERLAAATGMWNELLSELTEVVPTLPDDERAQTWLRLARLYGDKLNAAEYALTALDEALNLEPNLADAAELRLQLLRRLERWQELAAALGAAGQFVLQAEVLETRLGDANAAATAYRAALAKDATDQDARAALEQLFRVHAQWRDLAPLLDERATAQEATSPDDARALRMEAASLFERIDDRTQAIVRYEALATAEPRDLDVLRALERLYKADGQEQRYIESLGRQADVAEPRERAALYRRMASLYEELPGGADGAEECLEKLLSVDSRSEDALRSLERLYRADKKWDALVDVLRRHAAIVPPPIAGELHAQIGAIYENELRDPARAIEAFLDVETALPNHGETMAALTRLYEKSSEWQKAADVLERRAQIAEVKAEKLEHVFRAGEIYAGKLSDARAAETRFVRALELDPTHVPTMTALVEIYRKHGEFLKAAKLLVEAVPHTTNRLEKTRLYVEAGEIFDGLDDGKKATQLYLDALAVDPEHVEAGERVAELLWKAERYEDLVPVLEMLTRKESESPVLVERLVRLAQSAERLGLDDKIGKAYSRAATLDPKNLPAARGRAQWHWTHGQWPEALLALEAIFHTHVDDLPPSEKVELFQRLAACELQLQHKEAAKAYLSRALELDPTHRPSILLSMELGTAQPESLIDAKKALLLTAPVDEKLRLYTEIGDLWLTKLENRAEAIAAWREGLELQPENHKLLHKCLDVYVEEKSWSRALEMLERLIACEKTTSVRAKYRHAAGLICRDELGRSEDAATHLSAALDDDGSLERSAQALEELYIDRREWKALARFYRKTLKRLGPESPENADGKNEERRRIWTAVGDVCLSQLGERESALAALEVALTFGKATLERHKQIADLYVQAGPDKFDKAILEHQYILRNEKNRVVSYRALKHLYIQTSQRDKSIHLSYALAFLKKGEPDDLEKIARHKAQLPGLLTAKRTISDEMWQRLTHPDEDRYLDALFAIMGPMLAVAQAQPHKALGLVRKEALPLDDARSYAKALKYVATALGVPAPETYVRPEQKEPVTFAYCVDKSQYVPVFVLGAPLVGDKRGEREQVFELGRRVAQLRPERLLRLVLPQAQQLGIVVEAAMALGGDVLDETTDLGKMAAAMKRSLAAAQLEQVAAIGRKLRAGGVRGEAAALAWLQASDLTALRAGYMLAGDLETSARLVAGEPQPGTALPATQRLLDLVWSSVTEDMFAVRKHLGIL